MLPGHSMVPKTNLGPRHDRRRHSHESLLLLVNSCSAHKQERRAAPCVATPPLGPRPGRRAMPMPLPIGGKSTRPSKAVPPSLLQ